MIADDLSYVLFFWTKIIVDKSNSLKLYFFNNFLAKDDWRLAYRNFFFLSLFEINLTHLLHKLHLPSTKMIKCSLLFINSSFNPPIYKFL